MTDEQTKTVEANENSWQEDLAMMRKAIFDTLFGNADLAWTEPIVGALTIEKLAED